MCDFPKVVPITYTDPDNGSDFVFKMAVPCGKCYDCRRELANQFVLRARSEFQHSVCAYFVTLTYNDDNIRYYNPFDRVARRRELDKISAYGVKYFGMYKDFILSKDDAVRFCKSMQSAIKRYSPNLLFRYALNGEYGLYTQRPHMHALIYSPLLFNLQDFTKIIQSCWQFGNVTVSPVTPSRINYVAKHFMKTDVGSELQQEIAPIFQKRSTYNGGIGRDLVNDNSILINYYRDINYFKVGKYNIAIPRYIRKKLHPEKMTYDEMNDCFENSYAILINKLCDSVVRVSELDLKFSAVSDKFDRLSLAASILRDANYDLIHNKLRDFYRNKFAEHYLKLKNKEMLL